jgi:hypothetical protein
MQPLTSQQSHELMSRFPEYELSYETIPHRKVSDKYNVCMGIPVGKKCLLWYTFYKTRDVCFLIELNREKKPGHMYLVEEIGLSIHKLAYGSVFHGTWMDGSVGCMGTNSAVHVMAATPNTASPVFIIDDVLVYKGQSAKHWLFSERLGVLADYFEITERNSNLYIAMATMVELSESDSIINRINYPVHHIQYRALNESLPYLNITPVRKYTENKPKQMESISSASSAPIASALKPALYKPQYKSPTVFVVSADFQYDIYHLYAYGKGKELVYCGICYIANYKTSVFMNGIFRKIKENQSLDAIEESDDEEDFENTEVDKYVDLEKRVNMECVFHSRFKKWVPKRIVDKNQKVVHISML